MLIWVLFSLAAAPQPAARPDAGVVIERKPLDAGVPVVAPASIPHFTPGPSTAEVDQLRRDVSDLKSRTASIERQAAQVETITGQLETLSKQITDLQGQLTETEGRRLESERRALEKKERADQIVASLGVAQQHLASGSTANVAAALAVAESTFTGTALANIQSARAALANSDLGSARVWLGLAIIEAQTQSRGP